MCFLSQEQKLILFHSFTSVLSGQVHDIICAFKIMKNYRYYIEVNGEAAISTEQHRYKCKYKNHYAETSRSFLSRESGGSP